MIDFLRHRSSDFWLSVSVTALFIVGIEYVIRLLIWPSAGTGRNIVWGIQIMTLIVCIGTLFRWASLRERDKRGPDSDL